MQGAGAGDITVHLRLNTNGSVFKVRVKSNLPIKEFRTLLAGITGVISGNQILVFKGRIMTDDQTLISYGIFGGDLVDMYDSGDAGQVNANSTVLGGNFSSTVDDLIRIAKTISFLNASTDKIVFMCNRNKDMLGRLRERLEAMCNANVARAPPSNLSAVANSSQSFPMQSPDTFNLGTGSGPQNSDQSSPVRGIGQVQIRGPLNLSLTLGLGTSHGGETSGAVSTEQGNQNSEMIPPQ